MQWQATDINCSGTNQLIITQDQGDNTPTVFTFTDNDGVAINLTGMDFVGTVAFPVPVDLAIGTNLEITDAAAGELTMQLLSSDTQTTAPGQYKFDLWSVGIEDTPVLTDPVTGFWVINTALTVIS